MSDHKPFIFRLKTIAADTKHNQFRVEGRYCDVKIIVQAKEFLAHRNILASCSEFFENMLKPGTIEYDTGEIHVHEQWMDQATFEDFLQIAYLGEVAITDENCHALCKMAHFLMFDEMLTVTQQYIGERLDSENFFQLVEFAYLHDLKLLNKLIVDFLARNFHDVTALPQYLELSFECLKFILPGVNEHGALLEDLFRVAIKWIEHDVNQRSVHLFELLNQIPLIHFSGEFLRSTVAQNALILNSLECCQLVIQTLTQRQISSPFISPSNKGVIYAIGGEASYGDFYTSASIYDPFLNKWTLVRNFLEEGRFSFTAAFHLDSIFLFGGSIRRGGVQIELETVERIRLTEPNRKQETVVSFTNAEYIDSIAVFEDKIYVSGIDLFDEKLFSVMEQSPNKQTFTFSPATMMNSTAKNNELVAVGGYLYSLGGYSNSDPVKTVERYCSRTNKWIDMPDMHFYYDNSFQATALNGKLYVYGAQGFEMFDPETEIWTRLPMPTYKGNVLINFLACRGKLYLILGENSQTLQEFDPSTQQWTFKPEIGMFRNGSAVVMVDL